MASYKAIRLFFILIHANNGMLQVKRIKIGEECSTWKYSAWHGLINIMSSKTYHLLKSAVFQFCRFSSFLQVIQVSGLLWRWLSGYLHINSLPFLEALYPSSEEKKNTFSMLGNFSCLKFLFCGLLTFSKINFFKNQLFQKIFQEHSQGVRGFGSR